jgi:hypothetical protein
LEGEVKESQSSLLISPRSVLVPGHSELHIVLGKATSSQTSSSTSGFGDIRWEEFSLRRERLVSCIVLRFRIDPRRLDVDMLVTRATYAGPISPPHKILRTTIEALCSCRKRKFALSSIRDACRHGAWRLLFIQRASVLRSCFNGGGYLISGHSGRYRTPIGTKRVALLISRSSTTSSKARMVSILRCRVLQHVC